MFSLVRAYFAYTKDPSAALRNLVEQRRFGAAAAGYALAALCWVVFFNIGGALSAWGLVGNFLFFFLLESTLGYLWAALSGLFLNFLSDGNGSSSLFMLMGVSGVVQGLLLCFALWVQTAPWLASLAPLAVVVTLGLRLIFVVCGAARAMKTPGRRVLGALSFALVPVAAMGLLALGGLVWLATL